MNGRQVNKKNILLVTCLSNEVGLGHYKRIDSIAHFLIGVNYKIHITINDFPSKSFINKNYKVVKFEKENFISSILDYSIKKNIKLIIFDLHPSFVPKKIESLFITLINLNIKLISIDGLIDYIKYFEFIFFPSFNFIKPPKKYQDKIIYGWDCFLINPLFKKVNWKMGKEILILTGGSDNMKLGQSLPELLDQEIPDNYNINWVQGPYAKNPNLKNVNIKRFNVIKNASNLDDIIIKSNYAITLYGVSYFELIYYGLPSVVFSPFLKDKKDLLYVKKSKISLIADNPKDAINKLLILLKNPIISKKIATNARNKIKELGGEKLKKIITND